MIRVAAVELLALDAPPEIRFADVGGSILDYAPDGFDPKTDVVLLNRERVEPDRFGDFPEDRSSLLFVDAPGGFLSAATIVLGVLAVSLTLVTFGLQEQVTTPGTLPSIEGERESDSPTRGFNGIVNTRGAGHVIPFVYGEHRMGGLVGDEFERPIVAAGVNEVGQTVVSRSDFASGSKSTVYRRIIFCEGPIVSISAIQFEDVSIDSVRGVTYQTSIGQDDDVDGSEPPSVFDRAGSITPIDLDVTNATPAVFTTAGSPDGLELILRWKDGFWVRQLGIITGWFVDVKVEYRENNPSEPWIVLTGDTIRIREKAIQPLEMVVSFPPLDRTEYEIRVSRISSDLLPEPPDTFLAEHQSTTFKVKELIEYTDDRRSHPGFAELDIEHTITDVASQLIPSRITSLITGYAEIRRYSDPTTYAIGYESNNAWVVANFITHTGWGSGHLFTMNDIDIEAFIEFAQYCDEMVSDGAGGQEVRCRYDYVQDVQEDAQTIVNRIGFCGDAWIVLAGGKWRPVIDRAEPAVDLFNDANILPGLQYSYVPATERANDLNGVFTNRALNYARDSLPLTDEEALAAGAKRVSGEISCFGMTRASQVGRTLRRLLRWNRWSNRRLVFKVGLEAFSLTAGSVFQFASAHAGVGLDGGKIMRLADGGRRITLDGFVDIEPGESYEIIVRFDASNVTQSKAITTTFPVATRTDTVEVGSAWGSPIRAGDTYSVGKVGGVTQLFRCVRFEVDENFEVTIEARRYSDEIYTNEPLSIPVVADPENQVSARSFPPAPTDLTLLEHEPENSAGHTVKSIAVGWNQPPGGTPGNWEVYYRLDVGEESWELAGSPRTRGFDILPVIPDKTYRVAVVAVGPSGNALPIEDSAIATITIGV